MKTSLLDSIRNEVNLSEIKKSETSIQKLTKLPTASLPNLDYPYFNKNISVNKNMTLSDYKCSFKTKYMVETRVGSPVVHMLYVRKAAILLVALADGTLLMWKLDRILDSEANPGRKMVKMVHDIHYK